MFGHHSRNQLVKFPVGMLDLEKSGHYIAKILASRTEREPSTRKCSAFVRDTGQYFAGRRTSAYLGRGGYGWPDSHDWTFSQPLGGLFSNVQEVGERCGNHG